jgi:hypothetical protein
VHAGSDQIRLLLYEESEAWGRLYRTIGVARKGRKFETSAIITEKGVMRECEEPPGRFRGVEVV